MQSANNTTINPQEPNGSTATIKQPTPPDAAPTAAVTEVQPRPASSMSIDTDTANTAGNNTMALDPGSGSAPEILSVIELGCLCVLNDYMDLDTMKQIDNRPTIWSYALQRETFAFILKHAAMLHDVYKDNKARGSRKLCQRHIKELARGIGLLLDGISYETQLSRIDHVATKASSFEEFERLVLQESTTKKWFRNSTLRTRSPQQHNEVHTYRFSPLRDADTILYTLTEKLKCNGDQILADILSCFGVETALLSTMQEEGFLDIPKIFNWLFLKNSEMSIAEIALLEAHIHEHHLSTNLQSQNSSNQHLMTHQYGLVQQVVETYPIFYLLSILSQPIEHRNLFFVAYPNPLVHTRGAKTIPLKFEVKPGRRRTETRKDPFRAIIPISEEHVNACDQLLLGTFSEEGMRAFLDNHCGNVALNNAYEINPELLVEVTAKDERFSLQPRPIVQGGIRFLSSSIASSPYGSGLRTALQPQLLTVSNYSSDEAVLSNGVSLLDLSDNRAACIPMGISAFGVKRHDDLPAWPISERLSGITPLSQAIAIQRSFDDYLVLNELSILLSGDMSAVQEYLRHWISRANKTLNHHFTLLKGAERYVYGENSWSKTRDGQ